MRYRLRYNVGPLYSRGPSGRRRPGAGLLAQLLNIVWYVVAFLMQLVVWAVLLVVGVVYTIVWLIMLPFERLGGGRRGRRTAGSRL